jgi:hypothetical protein
MKDFLKKGIAGICFITFIAIPVYSQEVVNPNELGGQVNIISTAVPFMGITPDSRAGGMGNTGVATTPDLNSQHWNPAKFAFIDGNMGVGTSYTPWLRKLVTDINMFYLTGFYRLDEMQVLSASLRYFTLGEILFREGPTDDPIAVKPNEYAFDVAYSRMLSQYFSGSVAFRYIRSDLNSGISTHGEMQPGNSFAADLAFYFQRQTSLLGPDTDFAAGINISNIGNKISYDSGDTRQFIPTNLRLGISATTELDAYNAVSFAIDANKLLVPTPDRNTLNSNDYADQTRDTSVPKAMFQSFADAPGGFKEELQEITIGIGAEYWYDRQFAVRAGYFHEHENKGNRKHFTAGIGLKFNMLTLDASYIIPVVQNNPLANTVRFSLGIDLDQLSR